MIQIDELIKDSLKNKKTVELKVYRNLKADIMAFKTQKNAPEFTEAVFYSIINKYIKKMDCEVILGNYLPSNVTSSLSSLICKHLYCKSNNIHLLRLPYWDIDNINTIIDNQLDVIQVKDIV